MQRRLGPRQAGKRGNEGFPRQELEARWRARDTAAKNGGRESVSDADVGEDGLLARGDGNAGTAKP